MITKSLSQDAPIVTLSVARTAVNLIAGVRAVTTSGAAQHVLVATTNLRSTPIFGVSIRSATSGSAIEVVIYGPLDKSIFNLGAGVACAVGVSATGELVRATDPSCVSAPNWVGDCDTSGNIIVRPRRDRYFDVRDFGAVARSDDNIDDLPAFNAMIAAQAGIVSNNVNAGTVCWVPIGKYFLNGDLHVPKGCSIEGASTGRGNLTCVLRFPAGKGIIIDDYLSEYGYGHGARIKGLDIISDGWVSSSWWDTYAGQSVSLGTRVRMVREKDASGNPIIVDSSYPDDTEANRCRRFKTNGDNRLIYECTTPGIAGASEPRWNTAIGGTTVDGSVVWTTRVYPGIHMRSQAQVIDCYIQGFTNAGIHIPGTSGANNSNDWLVQSVRIVQCGCGLVMQGDEANSGLAIDVYIEASGYRQSGSEAGRRGGHGVWDHSFLGNCLVRVETAGDSAVNSGRAFIIDGIAARGTGMYLYSEGDQLPSHGEGPSIVMTGPMGPEWTPTTSIAILSGDGVRNVIHRVQAEGEQILEPIYDASTWMAFTKGSIEGSHYTGWRYENPNTTNGVGWYWMTYFGQLANFEDLECLVDVHPKDRVYQQYMERMDPVVQVTATYNTSPSLTNTKQCLNLFEKVTEK